MYYFASKKCFTCFGPKATAGAISDLAVRWTGRQSLNKSDGKCFT